MLINPSGESYWEEITLMDIKWTAIGIVSQDYNFAWSSTKSG